MEGWQIEDGQAPPFKLFATYALVQLNVVIRGSRKYECVVGNIKSGGLICFATCPGWYPIDSQIPIVFSSFTTPGVNSSST